MPQRSDQQSRDTVADDFSDILDDESESQPEPDSSSSFGQRAKHRAGSLFSPRIFLYAVLLLGAGMFAGNAFIPLPFVDSLAGLVGVFAGAFVLGGVVERSTILESAVAGAVAAGLTILLTNLTLSIAGGLGLPLTVIGAGTGLLAGALGAYFGGDLRDGLTGEL